MPTAPVDDKGTVLYYEDSGAPEGASVYTTIVLTHGTMFHGAMFRPMLPYAAEHNLRLVFLNLRDYPGSTLYSPEELEELRSPRREEQENAILARALELGAFFRWYLEHAGIPPVTETPEGLQEGGISILFCSAGNTQGISLIAHADSLPEETQKVIGKYLRSCIIYDPALTAVGGTPCDGLEHPMRSPHFGVSYEEMTRRVTTWISTYWEPVELEAISPKFASTLLARKPMHEQQKQGGSLHDAWLPSYLRMSSDEFDETADPAVVGRSQMLFSRMDPEIARENLRRALSQGYNMEDGTRQNAVWPALKIRVVWCDMSGGDEVWASANIRKELDELDDARPGIEMFRLHKANHFVHRDQPERFTRFLANIV